MNLRAGGTTRLGATSPPYAGKAEARGGGGGARRVARGLCVARACPTSSAVDVAGCKVVARSAGRSPCVQRARS